MQFEFRAVMLVAVSVWDVVMGWLALDASRQLEVVEGCTYR